MNIRNSIFIATGPVHHFIHIDQSQRGVVIQGVQMYGNTATMSWWARFKIGCELMRFVLRTPDSAKEGL